MGLKRIFFFSSVASLVATNLAGPAVNGTTSMFTNGTNPMFANGTSNTNEIIPMSGFTTLVASKTTKQPPSTVQVDKRSIETLHFYFNGPDIKARVDHVITKEAVPPAPPKTCTRLALAAVSKFRNLCLQDMHLVVSRVTHKHICDKHPSVRKCCGKEIVINDPAYLDYPTSRFRVQTLNPQTSLLPYKLRYEELIDVRANVRIINQHEPERYGNLSECWYFKTQTDREFQYYFWPSVMDYYGIADADEDGKVFGLDKWDPEGSVLNRDSLKGGLELRLLDELIIKTGDNQTTQLHGSNQDMGVP